MVVYVALDGDWDSSSVVGVFDSIEAATAKWPRLRFVKCGDGVEAADLGRGQSLVIEPHAVQSARVESI